VSATFPGYTQTPFGGWVTDDGSGPYLLNSDAGGDYTQLPSGFWVKGDGSGPYFYDVATGEATEITRLFRSL
jgi:hypothetical protein